MATRPMLATKVEVNQLVFPLFASPKLDGIRCLIMGDGRVLSRSGKPIPNRYVSTVLSQESRYRGLDGELIVGDPAAHDVYRVTESGVMSVHGEPDFKLWAFDCHDRETAYVDIYNAFRKFRSPTGRVDILQQALLTNVEEVLYYEEQTLALGYEGVILRRPNSPYKNGRSTAKEGYLLKLKRMASMEAIVIDAEEEMRNDNEATRDALGYTERSTSKAGLVGKGRLGALVVKDYLDHSRVFRVGTGFSAAEREALWREHADGRLVGKVVTLNHFPIGAKDLPRHPSFKGFRTELDL